MNNKTIIFYDFEATSVSRDADPISLGMVAVIEKYTLNDDTKEVIGVYQEIKTFYAEFTDFSLDKCDDWVKENIVDKLLGSFDKGKTHVATDTHTKDNKLIFNKLIDIQSIVSAHLKNWLSQFEQVEFWADFDVIDKPMLIDLIADWDYNEQRFNTVLTVDPPIYRPAFKHKVGLPKHLDNIKYYDFYDIHTLFKIKNINPDTDREQYAFSNGEGMGAHIQNLNDLGISHKKHNALFDSYINWKCYEKLNHYGD